MKNVFLCGLFMGLLMVPGVMAQTTVELDLDPAAAGIARTITISRSAPDSARTFQAKLVITGAQKMTGVSVDIAFDATQALDLVRIKEIPGDLNFSGDLQLNEEVLAIINQFVAEFNFEKEFGDFVDGFGRNSAVVYDLNNNQATDLEEVLLVINEFVDEFNFEATEYWTRQVTKVSENDGSVAVFDPVSKSNVGGANVGMIDDLTSVLLIDRAARGDQAFGFDGDAIVATLTFRVKSTAPAGEYVFSFPQAKWIDNTFTSVATDIKELARPAVLPKVIVTN